MRLTLFPPRRPLNNLLLRAHIVVVPAKAGTQRGEGRGLLPGATALRKGPPRGKIEPVLSPVEGMGALALQKQGCPGSLTLNSYPLACSARSKAIPATCAAGMALERLQDVRDKLRPLPDGHIRQVQRAAIAQTGTQQNAGSLLLHRMHDPPRDTAHRKHGAEHLLLNAK